jgi:hypothetical protein
METLRIQIEKILNTYEKDNLGIKFNSTIKNAYLKYLGIVLLNSKEFLKIHDDFNNNKLKNYYFLKDYEIYLLTKLFCKKNKINTKLYYSKFVNYFFLFLSLSKIILKIYFCKFYKYEKTKNKYLFYFENLKKYNQVHYSKIIKPKPINIDKKYLFNKSNFSFLDLIKIFKFKDKSKIRLIVLNIKALLYFKALKKLKPKIVFFVEGDSPDQNLISNLATQINYKTCCFQWGSITEKIIKYGFKNMSHNYFFTWSNYYSKIFKKFNKKTKFIISGNPLLKNIKPKNKILFLIHPKTVFISKTEDFELNNLIKILSHKYKKKIILRYHSLTKKKLDDVITHDQNNTRLIKSLGMSFCTIAVKSSAIIEASSLGIIPLILKKDSKSLGSEFDQLKNIRNNSLIFKNHTDVLKFLKKIINNIKFRKTISKNLKRKFSILIKHNGNTSIKITNHNIQNIIKSIK